LDLRKNYLVLGLLTAAGVVMWAAGWEVIGVLVTVVGGFGLFWGLIATADEDDIVIKAGGDALRLSKDEAELVTLIRDKNIDPKIMAETLRSKE
jgi:hypothetical protein